MSSTWKDLREWRVDECDIDAHIHVLDDGTVALLMTPLVARVIHEISGHCEGDHENPIRLCTNTVWTVFEDVFSLNPEHYALTDKGYEPKETEEAFDTRTARAIARRHG